MGCDETNPNPKIPSTKTNPVSDFDTRTLVPKLRLGTHFRETLFRERVGRHLGPIRNRVSQTGRSQTEFGNENSLQ